VPKSSIATRTPSCRSWSSTRAAIAASRTRVCSVISISSARPGRPAASSSPQNQARKAGSSRCIAEMLTASGTSSGSRPRRRARIRQAWRITSRPSGTTSPLSSHTRMNSPGSSRPRAGCCQRTSASSALTPPLARSISGWISSRNCPPSSASRSSASTRARRRTSSSRPGRKKRAALRPAALASYMARSALRSSASGSMPSSGAIATPTLPETCRRRPSISNGAASARSTASAAMAASSGARTSGSSAMNSSPPWRATVSLARSAPTSRSPACTSRRSPTAWPCRSLTCLKRSRSMNITATRPP
jgi:hypothetical protein